MLAVLAGLGVSAVAWPWYKDVSFWVGPTILLMVVTLFHMVFASRLIVPFPHIAIMIGGLQYTLAAWLSFYFPPTNPTYNIGEELPGYLAFGGAATIAFAFGWAAALLRKKGVPCQTGPVSPKLLHELDVLFWGGLAFGLMSRFVPYPSLSFFLLLCANLRYVGALGRLLVGGEGWQWRVALTLAVEILLATKQGMFHTLLLWTLSGFAVYLYRFRPRKGVVVVCILLGMLLLPAFQHAKWRLRLGAWGEPTELSEAGPRTPGQLVGATFEWFADLAEGLYRTATLSWDRDFLCDTLVRYNQGWIVHRVMQHVPEEEPYARGETLVTAAKAALLPRLVAPTKAFAGGRLQMARFAGMELEGASMNLGYAGELYANFGYTGAVAGCFVYAALLGLAFRWVAGRASRSPLWWVFLPYVGSIAFKAEEGIAEVLNWVVKASIVVALVWLVSPAIRAALWAEPDTLKKKGLWKSRNWENRKQKWRDDGTTRLRDNGTTGLRDTRTTGLRDHRL
jgi:hypothetical protein